MGSNFLKRLCKSQYVLILPSQFIGSSLDKEFLVENNFLTEILRHCYFTFSEKAMAPHSSTLAWKIPWTEEPGRLQFMGLLRVGHD